MEIKVASFVCIFIIRILKRLIHLSTLGTFVAYLQLGIIYSTYFYILVFQLYCY